MLAKPNAAYFSQKHAELRDLMSASETGSAVEGRSALESMMRKADASLAVIGMKTKKKRPRSLVMARTYDGQLLDLAEFTVMLEGCETFTANNNTNVMDDISWSAGAVPLVVFQGSKWQESPDASRLQSLLLDIFSKTHHQASSANNVSAHFDLKGLEHALVFSWREDDSLIELATHKLVLLKSGSKVPRIDLRSARPRLLLKLDRSRFAPDATYRNACKIPASLLPISKTASKNMEQSVQGTMGRIHLGRTDLSQLQTRKMKGLKKKKKQSSNDHDDESEGEDDEQDIVTKKIKSNQ